MMRKLFYVRRPLVYAARFGRMKFCFAKTPRLSGVFFERQPRKNNCKRVIFMDTRIALIGIIVEEPSAADRINAVLHEYAPYIVGRMGIPYRQKEVCIISVVIDAPGDLISALSGKLGMLGGVSIKTVYSKVPAGKDPGACAG